MADDKPDGECATYDECWSHKDPPAGCNCVVPIPEGEPTVFRAAPE